MTGPCEPMRPSRPGEAQKKRLIAALIVGALAQRYAVPATIGAR